MKQRIKHAVQTVAIAGTAAALAVGISVFGATTVGTNVSVDGTLTASGNSTFGDAATDINLFTGTLQASTTALFTSGLTAYAGVESAITRATGATGSFQNFAGDLTYQGAAGGASFYHAGVMGNFLGDTLTNANATVHAGVIGKYEVTTSDALVGAKAGLVGEAGTSVADAAVMAILGGDTSALTPNAAYGVQYFNSTAASKFSYGLDLFHAETTGYTNSAVDYGTADIRLQNGETISNATNGLIKVDGDFDVGGMATTTSATGAIATRGTLKVGANGTALTQVETGYVGCGPLQTNQTIAATTSMVIGCWEGLANVNQNDAVFLTATSSLVGAAAGFGGIVFTGKASTTAANFIQVEIMNLRGLVWTVTTSTWRYIIIR
ncbi:MAG: hypothetical protein HYT39_02960 [Candidatus Sungbacteria bacterium]|nr:hypothetical protein [Candidatus Sungbacteria bacterium]